MGIPFSCAGFGYSDLDGGFEALTVRSISFKGEDVNTIIRAISFKESDIESQNLKSYGSGKMVIEGSLSFKGLKRDPFQVETTFSIANPPSKEEEFTRTPGFQPSESSNFEVVSPKSCVSDPGNLKTGIDDTTFSANHPCSKEDASIKKCSFKSSELNNSQEESPQPFLPDPNSPKHEAAVKLQKVYKSFRTRRQLADCAVLVEQSWWKLLDFALLKRSSVSFFDVEKPESVVSRWSRARTRAAKVGKGLSKDEKARKLALQHWLEAIDPRHRYGHNLHLYYVRWLECDSKQPFFYWLDVGDGKEVTHERCSRWKLQQQCIKYLGPKEREAYEVMVEDGRFVNKQNGQLVDTSGGNEDSKWIFVLSTSKCLYVGQKKKGKFQHSSFLAGGATSSAGRLVVEQGTLKAIWPHSGHYHPTEENFQEFVSFLKENNVDLTNVKKSPVDDDESCSRTPRISSFSSNSSQSSFSQGPTVPETEDIKQPDKLHHNMRSTSSPRNLSGPSLESEGKKTCCSPSKYQVPNGYLEETCTSSKNVQEPLFGESESDEDFEVDGVSTRNIDVTDETDGAVEEACEQQNSSQGLQGGGSPRSPTFRFHKSNLFEERTAEGQEASVVPPELILDRIDSMKRAEPSHLRRQFSFKWTSGTGPRISCVRDYPSELQFRALEQVNLSPRSDESSRVITAVGSPRNSATTRLQSS